MGVEITAVTDIGNRKKVNQDSVHAALADTDIGKVALLVICDGVGGLNYGEVASAMTVKAFKQWFSETFPFLLARGFSQITLETEWRKLLQEVNQRIIDYGERNHVQLGTTLTAMLMAADCYDIVQIGDSRAYEIADGVQQLTRDQTLGAREAELGHVSREQLKEDPRSHVLLQCIGLNQKMEPCFEHGKLKNQATYLVCTDGFYNRLTEQELQEQCSPSYNRCREDMDSHMRQMIEWCKNRGETDNLSAIMVRT